MADAKRIVRIDYKAYFADADRLYDTTNADAAKEAGIFNEKVTYAPMAYIIGSGSLYADLDAAIAGAEIGKETEVTIPCEKAAGARNPRLIELHPIKEFYKNEINPYPGMSVSLGNRNGVVMSVGAGRVKVDFNNPLAGHDLKYEVTVVEEVTDPVEKAKCIMEMDFGTSEGFGFGIMEDKVVITEAEICKFHEGWAVAKYRLVSDYRNTFGVDRVEFVQVWESKKADAPAESSE
ncbi:MAG: peptidylprolyl isomerase [Methanomassiliicoccales archaeon Mx-03]|nr:peptidylprolyl isomerase [Methanomassiliicoccaceae archaeon DOK]TQS80127.1 MAG: peptidylprolyl isomerase [Methanomassiliicoccales archaeon Mx-03]